jgi:hypothetical protein
LLGVVSKPGLGHAKDPAEKSGILYLIMYFSVPQAIHLYTGAVSAPPQDTE